MTLVIKIKAIINTFVAPTEPIKASHISRYGAVNRSGLAQCDSDGVLQGQSTADFYVLHL